MARKKKDMDGGLSFFEKYSKKPIFPKEHNTYLNQIKNLSQKYKNINPSNISVNNLSTKVKLLNQFAELIKNNINLQSLLEELKLQLIEKIKLSLNEFIRNKFVLDYTLTIPELLDQLLDQLKEFEKLLNQLKLLDNKSNLTYYNNQIQGFINNILGKYEEYFEEVFRGNPNIETLKKLNQQVKDYINKYSKFIESMTNNRNNPVHTIIKKLKDISDRISIKISILSSQNGNHISNEMKRRINMLYKNKRVNLHNNLTRIQTELHQKYQSNLSKYHLMELHRLAEIGSKIELISRISNKNNKNILLRELRDTIRKSEDSLREYPEFQEYRQRIFPQ